MPGRPPHSPTSTSTRQKRTERPGTPSATVWEPISGKIWEKISRRQLSCFQTHQDAVLLAMQKRYNLLVIICIKLIRSFILEICQTNSAFKGSAICNVVAKAATAAAAIGDPPQ